MMNDTKREFPQTLYVARKMNTFPDVGSQLVGSGYFEGMVAETGPNASQQIAVYELVSVDSYRKITETKVKIEKL